MKAFKLGLIPLLVLACNGEPVTPGTGNEPVSYPSNFLATVQSNTSILVTWEDVTDATNYLVQAKTGSGTFVTVTDGTLVANDTDWSNNNAAAIIGKGIKQVNFTGLLAGTAYDFIIHPYNTGGTPDPDYKSDGATPTANATTTNVVVVEPPSHTTGFAATALSNTSINVSWVDAAGVDKYVVLAKTGAGSFATVADGSLVVNDTDWTNNNAAMNVNQAIQEVIFSGLVKNTSYDFEIYPYNEGGDPDPNYKVDGTVPNATATTQNNASVTFDETLVSVAVIDVSGSPFDITLFGEAANIHPQPDNVFSYAPQIVMSARSDGSYAVGWHDTSANDIKITNLTSSDTKSGSDIVYGSGIHYLGGFNVKDTEYVLGSVSGSSKEKYSIALVGDNGTASWTTDLTGTVDLSTAGSKQSPLNFGSARLMVDLTNQNIVSWISHEMRFPDNAIHQGGLFKFIDFQGDIIGGTAANGDDSAGGSNWLFSHNFDTRIALNNGLVAIVGNGDAIPRAVPIRIVDNTAITQNNFLFAIDGNDGDNDTKTQLGGLVPLSAGNFGLTFSTSVGQAARQVTYMSVGADGNKINQVWLTNYTAGTDAINVKTATYGTNYVVAWEEVTSSTFKAMFAIIDADGNIIEAPQQFSNIRFNRGDDFINFANGDVGWAIGSGSQLKIYRLELVDLGG